MTSWEEDAYFAAWGWDKDLIKRVWWAPTGHFIAYDTVMELSSAGPEGEQELREIIQRYGEKQHAER